MKPNTERDTIKIFESIGKERVPISGIEVQKKNAYRYSIFVENNFLMGVSEQTLVHFNLHVGTELTANLLQAIELQEQHWKIRDYFIRLLARRDHSRQELVQKAHKKGYTNAEIDSILDELEEKKYIRNDVFARKFAQDKFNFNHWGKQKIRMELKKKGIKSYDIEQALEELGNDEILEKMEYLVLKAKPRFLRAEKSKRRKKIFDFLIRKGYDSAHVMKVLPSLLNKLDA
ncbi:MAG: regulatory protein RecX [Balneolaceae bacterium]|nr:regulatory protein RecX [Balneolaceae bacterium]